MAPARLVLMRIAKAVVLATDNATAFGTGPVSSQIKNIDEGAFALRAKKADADLKKPADVSAEAWTKMTDDEKRKAVETPIEGQPVAGLKPWREVVKRISAPAAMRMAFSSSCFS